MIDESAIRSRFEALAPLLDERALRRFAAAEAQAAGPGGIAAVSRITGVARSTIGRGVNRAWDCQESCVRGHSRTAGGGLWRDQLLSGRDPKDVFSKDGLFDELKKALAERVLNAELDEHLDGEAAAGKSNHRNGYSKKTVLTETSKIDIKVPRDREGTFDPKADRPLSAPFSRLRRENRLDVCAGHDRARDPRASR